jgi:hypothetical protein
MNGMPPNPSSLTIAKESIAMSKETGDKNFRLMAMAMMAVTGIATVLHVGHLLWRDMTAKCDKEHDKNEERARKPRQHPECDEEQDVDRHDSGSEKSWVRKARVTARTAEGEKVWSEHHSHQNHSRQH